MADFTTNLTLELPAFGEREGTWGTGALNQNFTTIDSMFGVTTGHTHNGQPGSGGRIDHGDLLNSGTLSHAQIEAQLTSLQQQVDENNEIGTVRRLDPAGATMTTVLEVNTLDFVNCTVEQTSTGIAKITPIIPENSSYEVTAPVNHFDAFVGAAGMDLALQSWERVTPATSGTFNIQGTGNGLEVRNLAQDWLWQGSTGSGVVQATQAVSYVLSGVSPHSEVQRLCAVVEDAGWGDADPGNGEATGFDNNISLRLGLLTKKFGPGNGLFLEVTRASISGVSAKFVVYAGSTTYTVDVADLGGGLWQNKSYDHFLGQHEVSLSKDSVSGRYWLHYYYNKSLIYKYAEPIGGNNFFDAVADLVANLENDTAEPDFGHFNVAVRAQDFLLHGTSDPLEDVIGRPLNFKIDSIMASSTGERINPKFLSSGFLSESGTVATGAEVCSSFDPNPYSGLNVGESFQPYGGGPQLRVLSAGSASFEATNDATGEIFVFYCDSAGTGGGGSQGSSAGESGISNAINTEGNYVQLGGSGEFAAASFTASTDVPADWTNGNVSGDVIPAGTALPSSFIYGQASTPAAGLRYEGAPQFSYTLGNRLPIGTVINAQVNPAYDGASDPLTHTYTDVVEVDFPTPTNLSSKAWYYRNGSWSEITTSNRARRGDGLALTLTGQNLPLPGFWDAGVGFGRDYRIGDNVNCTLETSSTLFEGGQEYFSSFEKGGAAVSITGDMPTTAVPQTSPSSTRPSGVPTVGVGSLENSETILVVGRLDRCADLTAAALLRLVGKGGAATDTAIFRSTFQVEELSSVLNVQGTVEEGSTGATVDVIITYPNPDIAAQTGVFTSLSSDLTVTSASYSAITDAGPGGSWTVTATLTVNTINDGTAFIQFNDGCTTGIFPITVTATGAGDPGTPTTPTASISQDRVFQGQDRTLNISIPANNITEGDILTIAPASGTLLMDTTTHQFTASEAASGYSVAVIANGIPNTSPVVEFDYFRPGAASPQGPTQSIALALELPGSLTITGTTTYPYPGAGNTLEVQLGIEANASTSWAVPAWNQVTLTDSAAAGSVTLVSSTSLGNDQYGYVLEFSGDWSDNATVTFNIPNHYVYPSFAGTTQQAITLTVSSSVELVRMGNTLNRFSSTIIIEGATSAEYSGVTPEIVDASGTLLQGGLSWSAFRPISRGDYTGEATEEGVIDVVMDIPLSAFGDVDGSFQPYLRLGSDLYSIQKKVQGVFSQTTLTYLELPATLELELVGAGLGKQSQLNLTAGDEVTIDITGNPLAIIDPTDVGSPLTIPFEAFSTSTIGTTWTEDASVTDPRQRRFNVVVGEVQPGSSAASISLNLKLSDPTDPTVETQRTKYFPGVIRVVPSTGGSPGVGGLGAGS